MKLLTRSDFDGLICAVLLKEAGIIDELKFVHPKDMQDGIIEVASDDVLANVPYVPGCGLWFDHHSSEEERLQLQGKFTGESRRELSAARIIYDYYGGSSKFGRFQEMLAAVDKTDSGQLTADEILNPQGWILLGYIMDPRTGLGRYKDYSISNYQLMEKLIDWCRTLDIETILALPDVKERVNRYFEQNELFEDMLFNYSFVEKNIIITDLRGIEPIYTGNRFLIYSLFPDQNISMWIIDGKNQQNCVVSVGHSIIKRSSKVDVGSLLLQYGGGGHAQIGTCQIPYDRADEVIAAIRAKIED